MLNYRLNIFLDELNNSLSGVKNNVSFIAKNVGLSVYARGLKTSDTLNFAEPGTYRIEGLTKTNSPSSTDVDGVLVNMSAIYTGSGSSSATLQLFYGQTSNTLYARLQWYDSYTRNWIKLSN